MQIEVGKFYKTGVGNKVKVIGVADDSLYKASRPFVVQFEASVYQVDAAGKSCNTVWDLVSEWRDPIKHERWIQFYRTGLNIIPAISTTKRGAIEAASGAGRTMIGEPQRVEVTEE